MKNRLFKRLLLAVSALSLSYPLASCAFFDTGEGAQIKEVTPRYDEATGNTIITITFTDEEMEPVTFIVPRGISGKDGVSIKNISSKMLSDGKSIELTISYSDSSVENTVISVPVLEGKGVKEVLVDTDEDGNKTIQFTYTDESKGPVITIPKGKDGNGIASFEIDGPDSDGNTTITVTLDDGTKKEFTVSNGRDGVSVSNITYDDKKSDATHYVLTIKYTDGYTEEVVLDRPRSTRWFTGTTTPDNDSTASSQAIEGDFFLNRINGYVYQKTSDESWTFLFGMKADGTTTGTEVYHTVFFDPGLGKINGNTGILMASVLEGKTMPLSNIPTPTYEDHTFLGWYTDLTNVNAGQFTDLTPVFSDLKLYAKYGSNA